MSIDIQIWSDIACPWCFVGKRRLESALASFPQRDQVNVSWRSYQLDPGLPEQSDLDEITYLSQMKGLPRETVEQMVGQITQVASEEGLHFDYEHLAVANSRRAHRMLQAAKRADAADGGSRTYALKEALLSAHFEKGGNIGDADELVELGVGAGLDREVAYASLDSDDLDAAVESDIRAAAELGIRGVPFFVIDGKYGISGAQPVELFQQALATALKDQAPTLISLDGESGGACGPEGC